MERHVSILRDFRDTYLLPHRVGSMFVKTYYRYSPPVADFIADHDNLRAALRLSLLPVVGASWVALKLGPVYSLALIFLLFSGLLGLFCRRRMLKKI
jgi:hypothetical protein